MMISVRIGVTLTSTPEYPSSASSLVRTSLSSAKNTPSATNYSKIKAIINKHSIHYILESNLRFGCGLEVKSNLLLLTHLSCHDCRSEMGRRPLVNL